MMAVDQVYRVHSTVEVSHEDVTEYLDDPDLPDAIERLDATRRGNQLFIESVPADGSVGKYTPTATLRATVTDTRIYEYEGTRSRTEPSTPEDVTPPSTVETFANFKGRLGTVMKNRALRAPMFGVFCDIARRADQGRMTAIVGEGNTLSAVRIEDGKEVPASVEVTEHADHAAPADLVNPQNTRP
jgi:hypothetical protein